jgi:YbbR domain-containing protein
VNPNRLIRSLTANLGAKIVALLFAVFLWLHVTAQQLENQTFRVPLTLTDMPDSLIVIHDVPEFVEVTIRGSRSNLLKLRLFGRLKATVDLSDVKRGRINIPLSPVMLNISEDFDPRDIEVEEPKTLTLNFERVVTRVVPVRVAYRGEIPQDIIIRGTPTIIPDRVQVKGASSIVSGITMLNTEEIDVRGKRGKLTQEVDVNVGGRSVTVNPVKVLVEIELSRRGVRTLANLPPTLLQDVDGVEVTYSPKTVSLTIEGPEEVIKEIASDKVSILLNITTRKPGSYKIRPEIKLPQGIEKYWLDVEYFDITIHSPSKK